jgi:hypothetical protein
LVRTKKLQKKKMQLSPESGNVRLPLPDSGEHVWPDLAKIAGFRPDSSQSVAGSRPFFARSDQISDQIHPNPAGFWPWPDSNQIRPESDPRASGDGGRMLPDFGALWISTTDH